MIQTLTNAFMRRPKKMYFEGEDGDEEILYVLRRAFITNWKWIVNGTFIFLAPTIFNLMFLSINKNYPGIIKPSFLIIVNSFWYIFSVGFVFERFLNWFFNVYIITNKRVVDMDFNHLLHRNISEAPLRNIEDITYTTKGAFQTIFNLGHISIQTAAEQRELEFEHVPNPAKVQDILSDLVSEVRGYYGG